MEKNMFPNLNRIRQSKAADGKKRAGWLTPPPRLGGVACKIPGRLPKKMAMRKYGMRKKREPHVRE